MKRLFLARQIMEHLRLLSKMAMFITILLLSIVGCRPSEPNEEKLNLGLNGQVSGVSFSLNEYCLEMYDNIFILYPYFYADGTEYEDLKMSRSLRTVCDINIGNEAISTVLFIKDGIVVAYAEVERNDADFATEQIERTYIFPFHQDFIMDEDRRCRFCEE